MSLTPIYIASIGSHAGKSIMALVLGLRLRERGLRVAYFKPVGTLPVREQGTVTDEDALFICQALGCEAPLASLCPVLLTAEVEEQALQGQVAGLDQLDERVTAAYREVSRGAEVAVVGGIGNLSRGALINLSGPRVAELLEARVVLVARYESEHTVEEVLLAAERLGERLAAVAFNYVAPETLDHVCGPVRDYLEGRRIAVIGAVPRDEVLGSVTVRELAEQLNAKVLCCEGQLDELIKQFVIGAMNVASAVKYFREREGKAVITGGDRPDIQLAALQTPTKAIILTGNLHPSAVLVKRAQQVGVPMLLVSSDTLSTVERIESIVGKLRVRERAKVERARELLEQNLNFDRLLAIMGIPSRQEKERS
jgi:BioD-like phosphotransacetylase family protein